MSEFITVCKVGAVAEGEGQAFNVGGKMLAVFNVGGEYFAINDFCPHMGASLAGGHLEGDAVSCPWHAWRFCVRDGAWLDNPKISTDAYELRIEGDEIQVCLDAKRPEAK
ncbi:MAG: Rieske 2Fe-2S domain-containing protein [Planctomycetales bacterium]|nr:Rieske 2Fe-2S domain-containing protein [Planctomycetales bacterium]